MKISGLVPFLHSALMFVRIRLRLVLIKSRVKIVMDRDIVGMIKYNFQCWPGHFWNKLIFFWTKESIQ